MPWGLRLIINADFNEANNSRRIYFLHFDWLEKNYFAATYFASQESRNDFYFFVAKYFASIDLFASWKTASKHFSVSALRLFEEIQQCLCIEICETTGKPSPDIKSPGNEDNNLKICLENLLRNFTLQIFRYNM